MEILTTKPDKTVASLIHVSTFSKYIIPFGNFILPLILWSAKKNDPFVNEHGKQALNFQISIFLYFVLLICIGISGVIFLGLDVFQNTPFLRTEDPRYWLQSANSIPIIVLIGIIGLIMLGLFILEIVAVIKATIKASEGELYNYPLTINFITPTSVDIHQSKNEQFNNTQNETL
ncbi:MAG TPA: DUF4870 domain-containing protein [Gillisia sp.]|nr:DUF4870 domain-containing protein [Gillisia sp.]